MMNLALAVLYALAMTVVAALVGLWLYGEPWKVGIGFVFGVLVVGKFHELRQQDRIRESVESVRAILHGAPR